MGLACAGKPWPTHFVIIIIPSALLLETWFAAIAVTYYGDC
jgi:hypothetical protein